MASELQKHIWNVYRLNCRAWSDQWQRSLSGYVCVKSQRILISCYCIREASLCSVFISWGFPRDSLQWNCEHRQAWTLRDNRKNENQVEEEIWWCKPTVHEESVGWKNNKRARKPPETTRYGGRGEGVEGGGGIQVNAALMVISSNKIKCNKTGKLESLPV